MHTTALWNDEGFDGPWAFISWLRTQVGRPDAVGDLAHDHLEDEHQRGCDVSADDLRWQLRGSAAAEQALERAFGEWRQTHQGAQAC